MTINLNTYSYLNDVNTYLKAPLLHLIVNAGNAVLKEDSSQIALHGSLALLLGIPAILLSILGSVLSYCESVQVDGEGLSLAPPPILPPDPSLFPDDNIEFLYERYEALGHNGWNLQQLCGYVREENADHFLTDNVTESQISHFYAEFSLYLKGIIVKIKAGEVPEDKQEIILKELSDAVSVCSATWMNVAKKHYEHLQGIKETDPRVKVLRHVQMDKEEMILQFIQISMGVSWHGLTYVKKFAGTELGLSATGTEHDVNVEDEENLFGKRLVIWAVMQQYRNANRLIEAVQTSINTEPYSPAYYDFLKEIVQAAQIADVDTYVREHFFSEDGVQMTQEGVAVMLREVGILAR